MKKYSIVILSIVSGLFYSQITIGKTTPSSSPANASVSIEFGNETGGNKGIVLPWVSTAAGVVTAATPALGTIIFDSNDQKVKYRRIISGTTIWNDLSVGALTPSPAFTPDSNDENTAAKVLVGGNPLTDSTPGVLVLGDTNKAMVLPRVSSIADIVSPSAGMMVFLTGTSAAPINQLAVFNGKEWTFWSK